jgi:pullulanase
MYLEELKPYMGNDLGAVYTAEKTIFRLWAPTAEQVRLNLYRNGDGDCLITSENMTQDIDGTWICTKRGDLDQIYYTYLVTVDGVTKETVDSYAKAVGVNGERGMVVDLFSTNPDGFLDEVRPGAKALQAESPQPELLQTESQKPESRRAEEHRAESGHIASPVDAVICEISVADMTMDESSGVTHRGKYIGLAERGTKSPEGIPTGLDYLKALGITHVQLMPVYDFGSIDESKPQSEQYNWGYDPVNYNVPEGSYSTDPYHGAVRIRELKEMIQAFHREGIGVIMDVVYNHTYDIEHSCFQKTVPDYYYRKTEEGYSNASGCGNEIASERPMVRKYIVDSVSYWAREYHMDGFRFDLMGVLDKETMRQIRAALDEISPDILVYGEGWTGGSSALPEEQRAMKRNVAALDGIGAFSDDIRDNVRGSVFDDRGRGFASGVKGLENAIRYSVAGACAHPQVDYENYTYTSSGPWAANPTGVINYVSCHDNRTLWDKLLVSCPDDSMEKLLAKNRLSAAIVYTSQGIPFFLSGEEIARTKPVKGSDKPAENSYNLPFFTNSIKYGRAKQFEELLQYYKGLIAFRKTHAGLRLRSAKEVAENLKFMEDVPKNVVAFTVTTAEECIFVAYNANEEPVEVNIPAETEIQTKFSVGANESGKKVSAQMNVPETEFHVYVEGTHAGTTVLGNICGSAVVAGISCLVAAAPTRRS